MSGSGAGDGGPAEGGLSPEACGPAFPVAAAWLVLAGLEAGTDGVTSFSAGDLTVHTGGDGAGAMRRQAERLMAPIWRTDLPFGGCWGESGHHFRPAGPVWAVCDALPRRRGARKRGAGLPPAPAGGGGGTGPPPPPGAAAGGPVSDAGGAGRPGGPGDRVVWRESGYEVRTAHPIYLGRGCPTGGQCWPPGAREET